MVTFPGPCTTHVGVGMGVAVEVTGIGVRLAVAVKYKMGGKGVDAEVESGLDIATVPVHADNKNKTPTNILSFFIIPSMIREDDSDPKVSASHPG